MKNKKLRSNLNPAEMTKREVKQANALARRMKASVAKDAAKRDR